MKKLALLLLLISAQAFAIGGHYLADDTGIPATLAAFACPTTGTAALPKCDATITGNVPLACIITAVGTGSTWDCDMAPLVYTTTYTLQMFATSPQGCVGTGTLTGQCTQGGAAQTSPFFLKSTGAGLSTPTNDRVK